MVHRHRGIVGVVLLATVLSPRTWADDVVSPTDPVVFVSPRQTPSFREVLKGGEWDKQFAVALATLGDLDALTRSTYAASGALIGQLVANEQGAKLGLVVGDIITEIDGRPINQREFNDFREDHDQQLTVVNRDGGSRQLTISAGPVGINVISVLRPELVYLRAGARNPKWDAYAAVGAAFCQVNPSLAETAWHHAMKAGYSADAISDFCGAHIAWRGGRMEEALACSVWLQSRKKIPAALDAEMLHYALGVANFKLEQALARNMSAAPGPARVEGDLGDLLQGLLSAHRQRPEAERIGPSPSEIALYVKSSLLKQMEPRQQDREEFKQYEDEARKNRDQLAKQEGPFHLEAPAGSFRTVMQMPTVDAQDVELSVEVKLKRFNDGDSPYTNELTVALVNCDDPKYSGKGLYPAGDRMLNVVIEPTGECAIRLRSKDGVTVQRTQITVEMAGNRQFKLRLLHAAGRDEVWIDQQRLLYLPACEQPKRVGFHFGTVGVKADLRVSFYKLDPLQVPVK